MTIDLLFDDEEIKKIDKFNLEVEKKELEEKFKIKSEINEEE